MNLTYSHLKRIIKEVKEKKINEQTPTPMPSLQPAALANLISGISKLAAKDLAAAKAQLAKLPPDAAKAIKDQLSALFPEKEEETETSTVSTTTASPAAIGALSTSGE
jgi:hypothetical protein